jgi:hypothetical protein
MKIIVTAGALILLNCAVLLIPMIEMTTCTQGSTDAWLISLYFYAPLTVVLSLVSLIGITKSKILRWFTLPQLVLMPYSLYTVGKYIMGVTVHGNHPCSIATGNNFNSYLYEGWITYWGPAQLAVLTLCGLVVFQFWRPKKHG